MQETGQARTEPVLLGIEINGNYGVIYSPLGLAGGWEMSQSPYARGHQRRERHSDRAECADVFGDALGGNVPVTTLK